MSSHSVRLRALPLAVLVALAVPASANAAMGGGNALTTSLRPDLRSATVQSTNAVDDTTTVRVCFSKAIASLPQSARFHMGTYNAPYVFAGSITATSATRSTSNCADAVFPNFDATQFTFVTVDGSQGTAPDGGTSAVSTNGFGNIEDSTALIGSKTNNGTRGFSTGPDLVGITVNNAAATIDYTFDQRVGGIVGGVGDLAGAFSYSLPNGTPVNSLPGAANRSISSDGLTVRVNFPAATIQNAVRGFVQFAALVAKSDGSSSGLNPGRSAARPGSAGFTDAPDLVSVTVNGGRDALLFQYDQVLTAVGAQNLFHAGLAFSGSVSGNGAPTIVGGAGVGNTVSVPCTSDCNRIDEYIVSGWADAGAATGAALPSTFGGVAAGGNAGAFATGFTTAPEALSVTFDNATDIARVRMDQRWQAEDNTLVRLIDDQGSQIAAGAINITGGGSPTTCQCIAEITFPAGTLAGARSLLLRSTALFTTQASVGNVTQVISPTAPAAKTARKFRRLGRAQR